MTTAQPATPKVDRDELRRRVSEKYRDVALNPELGFHFHTGAPLARATQSNDSPRSTASAGSSSASAPNTRRNCSAFSA